MSISAGEWHGSCPTMVGTIVVPFDFLKGDAMKLIVKVAVLLVVLGLAFSTSALAAGPGADTFKAKCAMCHGADGSGNTAMGKKFGLKDMGSADVQKETDAQLTQVITKGKDKMPEYGSKLSADDIKNLVAFIRTLKK